MSYDMEKALNEIIEQDRALMVKEHRIMKLEAALQVIRGLVQPKMSTMIRGFARNDVLRIIDKALNEDSDDE